MLAESIEEKNSLQVVAIEQADGKDSRVERVKFFDHLAHCSFQAEACVEGFGDKSDLSVATKVLMTFVERFEHGSGSRECGNILVVSVQDVLEHEGLEGPIISSPCAVTFGIRDGVRLME